MVTWNPFSAGYFDNPYHHLRECRQTNPIQQGIHKEWILFKHRHVRQALKSDLLEASNLSGYFASKEKIIFGENECPFLAKGTRRWVMYLNGTEHRHTSDLADDALRRINVTSLIDEAITASIPQFEPCTSLNLVDLASVIPFYFSKKMMGFDDTVTYDQLTKFSHKLAISQDLFLTKKDYREINAEFEWAYREFEKMLSNVSTAPADSLAAILPELDRSANRPLSKDDMYSLLCVLFMASFETTKDSLSTILAELMRKPLLMEYVLSANEKEINVLTEELLRIASPLQYTVRVCKDVFELEGKIFPAGSRLLLALASANRDEEVFDQPDEIIPGRDDNPQLAFGMGEHACLGARIARQEIRGWLKPLCRFLVNYKVPEAETPQWQRTILMRGLKQLTIVRK